MTAASYSARLEPQAWMTAPETRAVVAALTARGTEVRFVGGPAEVHRLGEFALPE